MYVSTRIYQYSTVCQYGQAVLATDHAHRPSVYSRVYAWKMHTFNTRIRDKTKACLLL